MSEQSFGRYELLGTLGEGGFATVYRAWNPTLPNQTRREEVALKVLLPHMAADPDIRSRFVAEWQALARIRHPNVVVVHDIGEALPLPGLGEGRGEGQGRPFFTMELIDGWTLADFVHYGRGLAINQVIEILTSLCSAIDWLHAAGIVHRDIKAANVMRDRNGRVVLMDFGIAHSLDQAGRTHMGAGIGTPETMAPEQVRGQPVTPAADIYALGILSYQLLAGRLPFIGDTVSVLHAQTHEPPPPLRDARPGLARWVYDAVDAALAKDPGRRPKSAGAFLKALSGAAPLPPPPDDDKVTTTQTDLDTETPPKSTGIAAVLRNWLGGRRGAALMLAGPGGVQIPLQSGSYTLGRDPSCDICFEDEQVSRQHARLVVEEDRIFIEDLGSRNGTFVNGQAVVRAWADPGDVIRLGNTELEVQEVG